MGKYLSKFKTMPATTEEENMNPDQDAYNDLFQKCADAINNFYSVELHSYIRDELLEIKKQIDTVEKNLDLLWDTVSLVDFRKELIKFYKLHEEANNRFKNPSHD